MTDECRSVVRWVVCLFVCSLIRSQAMFISKCSLIVWHLKISYVTWYTKFVCVCVWKKKQNWRKKWKLNNSKIHSFVSVWCEWHHRQIIAMAVVAAIHMPSPSIPYSTYAIDSKYRQIISAPAATADNKHNGDWTNGKSDGDNMKIVTVFVFISVYM